MSKEVSTQETFQKPLSYKQEMSTKSGFMVAYNYLTHIPPAEGFMMVYLIDAEDICRCRLVKDPNFFECTYDFIRAKCDGWSRQNIITAMKNLQKRGLIEIINVKIGNHTPRFIKINHDKLKEMEKEYKRKQREASEWKNWQKLQGNTEVFLLEKLPNQN